MKTFQMKWMRSCVQLVLLIGIFQSCVDEPFDPNKDRKKGEFNCEVSQEGDVRIFNDCSHLQAFIQDFGEFGYDYTMSIRAMSDKGDQGAMLTVYYNRPEDFQSGFVYANVGDGLGTKPLFSGQVMTNISGFTDFKAYTSLIIEEGEEDPNAKIQFTRYDQTNGIVSGTFSYKAQEMTMSGATGNYRQVTGSFKDVVLFPSYAAADECYGGPGLPSPTPGNGGPNPNPNPGNVQKTSMNFRNNTFTQITLSADGQTVTINPGASMEVKGTPSSSSTFTAETFGKTSSGTQVGLKMTWNSTFTYPAVGSNITDLNISGEFFYLKVINNSSLQMTKFLVNYGLASQTQDNVVIANNGQLFGLGYYRAYSNSNVRAENGTTYWSWTNFNLSGALNQSLTVTGN